MTHQPLPAILNTHPLSPQVTPMSRPPQARATTVWRWISRRTGEFLIATATAGAGELVVHGSSRTLLEVLVFGAIGAAGSSLRRAGRRRPLTGIVRTETRGLR